jgi:arylformamidase
MPEYRARVDADVSFTNGGGLSVHGFLLDIADAAIRPDQVSTALLASLGLLMAGEVNLRNVEIIEAAHKGTRGGPGEQNPTDDRTLGELSHPIEAGMVTYPGLPAPSITPFLTRADSRAKYAPGTEFAMDCMTLIGNTGTYLDSPYHRYDGGTDLAGLTLDQLAELPVVLVRVTDAGQRGVDAAALAAFDVRGKAVLIHTGNDARFGTPEYAVDSGYLGRDGAQLLVDSGAVLVGIDSINIDDPADGTRPAHTILLGAGIPIVEHLTGLAQLPPTGAIFTAVPPRVRNFGTFPVRAYASIPAQR